MPHWRLPQQGPSPGQENPNGHGSFTLQPFGGGMATDAVRAEYADVLSWDKAFAEAAEQYRMLWNKGVLGSQRSLRYARALMAVREYDAASGLLEELARREPGSTDVLEARADLAFVLRHYDRAEGFYRVLLSARRDDPLPYSKLADISIARQ